MSSSIVGVKPKRYYCIGSEIYILVLVTEQMVILVSLDGDSVTPRTIEVEDCLNITELEWCAICNGTPTPFRNHSNGGSSHIIFANKLDLLTDIEKRQMIDSLMYSLLAHKDVRDSNATDIDVLRGFTSNFDPNTSPAWRSFLK